MSKAIQKLFAQQSIRSIHQLNETKAIQDFVFGYGSLICPNSRAKTVPEIAGKCATPVVVEGVQRTWAKRARRMTAMGISFVDNAECVGVLLPVEKKKLIQFDQREQGYNRIILNLNDIRPLLPVHDKENSQQNIESCSFLRAKNEYINGGAKEDNNAPIRIWVYVQQQLEPPNASYPIVQSYVDVILRGCLSISDDFAKEFILHTIGWSGAAGEEEVDSCNNEAVWVDDRHDPIYSRAEQEWSLKRAEQMDELLQRYRPHQFKKRVSL